MFKKHVVFVIGAGASAEFELPTGYDLKKKIANAVRFRFDFSRLIGGSNELLRAIRVHCKDDLEKQNIFTKCGNELAATIDTFPSIDEALHYWSGTPEIVALGKAAVAMLILEAERSSILFGKRDSSTATWQGDTDENNWVWHFMTLAFSALKKDEASRAFEKVTIINFNYDRVIEHYLYHVLQKHAGLPASIAAEAVNGIHIIRPYGSVGKLEWASPGGVHFGNSNRSDCFSLSGSIRTYTEQHRDESLEESIDVAISNAKLVVFLGFGFHAQNMSLFQSRPGNNRQVNRQAIATVKGIDQDNYDVLAQVIESKIQSYRPKLTARTAATLLQELRPTIMNIVG